MRFNAGAKFTCGSSFELDYKEEDIYCWCVGCYLVMEPQTACMVCVLQIPATLRVLVLPCRGLTNVGFADYEELVMPHVPKRISGMQQFASISAGAQLLLHTPVSHITLLSSIGSSLLPCKRAGFRDPCLAGTAHICGVDRQAAVWCMGSGVDGQLGAGAQYQFDYKGSASPLPLALDSGSPIPFYSVSAGGRHTCGVSPRDAISLAPSPAVSPAASPLSSPPQPNPLGQDSGSPKQNSLSSSSAFPVGAVVGAVAGAAGELNSWLDSCMECCAVESYCHPMWAFA